MTTEQYTAKKAAELAMETCGLGVGSLSTEIAAIINAALSRQAPAEDMEQVRKDAGRYRWLRDNYHGFAHLRSGVLPHVTVDSEVDAAIERAKREG